ncbi:hypothetical protein [Cohnella terricola]|uniref:Uncharacterized protein n=1 Tax=Cohnella terricola TaxID=1289167 RepID=A0A559JXA2_9BACL|nr:hypothetical protein [Cohnella terricola]TVY04430.1 hypothetical protein FPZ45_02280 [Cohnella terricola]
MKLSQKTFRQATTVCETVATPMDGRSPAVTVCETVATRLRKTVRRVRPDGREHQVVAGTLL